MVSVPWEFRMLMMALCGGLALLVCGDAVFSVVRVRRLGEEVRAAGARRAVRGVWASMGVRS